MDFTGERFIPGCGIDIAFEHFHRYLFAKGFVGGKKVLDLACGEGYGSFMLSRTAEYVMGLDIDGKAVDHAVSKYGKDNLEYRVADCTGLHGVVEDNSVDVVVFFEALEHIDSDAQIRAFQEIKRVLKDDGCLVLSTPNKYLNKEIWKSDNPYHLHELTLEELAGIVDEYFSNMSIFGQRVETASLMWPLKTSHEVFNTGWNLLSDGVPLDEKFVPAADEALYYIAVCSNSPVSIIKEGGVLLDMEMRTLISALEQKDDEIRKRDGRITELEQNCSELVEKLRAVYDSSSWKMTRPLRGLKLLLKK